MTAFISSAFWFGWNFVWSCLMGLLGLILAFWAFIVGTIVVIVVVALLIAIIRPGKRRHRTPFYL